MTTTQGTTAHQLADDIRWRGPSGESVTGPDVARHIETTLALLDTRGWVRVYNDDDPGELHEGSSFTDVLRVLLRMFREDRTGPLTLSMALYEASGDDGDYDSYSVARRCLEQLLRHANGGHYVDVSAWAGRRGRTPVEVRELLETGAEFARRYGPHGGGSLAVRGFAA